MSVRKVVPIESAEWHIAPAPTWVIAREPDWDFDPPDEHAVDFPLIDEQHHTETQACFRRTVRRVETIAAIQSLGQVEVEFDPAAARLLIHELAIWRKAADGRWEKRPVARRESFLLRQREQQLEQQMLNGRVSVVALLEDLRVGDAIDLSWTLEPNERLPGLHFSAFYAFAWVVPVARVFFTLHRSLAVPLTTRLHAPSGAVAPLEESTPEQITWSLERPPIFKPEPNVPGSHWAFPMVDVSAWSSWAQVAEFAAGLWADALAEDAEVVAAEAQRLLAAANGDAVVAARGAIRFVQEEIRYLAVDFGHGGGMLPNGAGTVLRRRFGDCKDKSVLLTALLRALGIEAWPMLIGAGWREAVVRVQPSPAAFSHAIVTFLAGERRVFVDPTIVGQGGDLAGMIAPPYGCGLEVRAGADGLTTLPPLPSASLTLTETFHLDRKKGSGSVEQMLHASSWLADDVRGALVRQGAASFQKARFEALQRLFPALQPREAPAQVKDDAAANTIEWTATHDLPTWGPVGQKPPPMFRYGAHGLFLAVESLEGPEQRHQPWALRYPMTVRHRVVVRGRCVSKGKAAQHPFSGPGFRYVCDVTSKRREVAIDYRWETTLREIAPGQWREYCQEREKAFGYAGANVATGGMTAAQRVKVTLLCVMAVSIAAGAINEHFSPEARKRPRLTREQGKEMDRDLAAAYEAGQKGDYTRAEKLLRPAAPYLEENFDFQVQYAEALLSTGHLDEVPPVIAKARKLKPDSGIPDALEGMLLQRRGELTMSRLSYQKALEKSPDNLPALYGMGCASELLGDRGSAARAWERFLALHPGNPEVLQRYALLLWSSGVKQKADDTIVGYIRSQPVAAPLLESTLASYYAQTGRPAEAVAPAKRAAELAPSDPAYILRYALALTASGDAPGAVEYVKAKAATINHPLVWQALAVSASSAGRFDEAGAAFQKWLQGAPRDPEAHASYGYFLHKTGRNEDARATLERALRDFPGHGLLWMNYSVVLEALGDPKAVEARSRANTLMSTGQVQALTR